MVIAVVSIINFLCTEHVSCISVYNNSSKDGYNEITLIINQEKLNLVEKCELF